MKRQMSNKGFSLIEVMIVVVLIAITLTLAVPTYNSFVTRSRITELIAVSSKSKVNITEFVATTGQLPHPKKNDGFEVMRTRSELIDRIIIRRPKKHTIFVEVRPGQKLRKKLKRKQAIVLRGTLQGGTHIMWECGTYSNNARKIPSNYLPATCRTTHLYNGKV